MLLKEALFLANQILFESFKDDLINTYNKQGIDISKNQEVLNAINLFNTNNNIKNIIKKDLKYPANLGITLANTYKNPEDFVKYINSLILTRKQQASSYSNDFYVYPCRTYQEARKAAFSHVGNLERLTNQQIKDKYKIDVPEPNHYYETNKSPKEFLEFMKSAPFFMAPSWCITSKNENFWNHYKLTVDKNEEALCYIIISKQYPNLRFCIVKEKKVGDNIINLKKNFIVKPIKAVNREIRDTWQIGGGNTIDIGESMLLSAFKNNSNINKIITDKVIGEKNIINIGMLESGIQLFENNKTIIEFNNDLSNLIDGILMFKGCKALKSFNSKLPALTNGSGMFEGCYSLKSFDTVLPKLSEGESMFNSCENLTSFNIDLPKLTYGYEMFAGCENLATFNSKLPSLDIGTRMFNGCKNLTSFNIDLPKLTYGYEMFAGCENLTSFNIDLPSLEEGIRMFKGCELDKPSVIRICKSIPKKIEVITLGIDKKLENDNDINNAIKLAESKGWNVEVEFN